MMPRPTRIGASYSIKGVRFRAQVEKSYNFPLLRYNLVRYRVLKYN